MLACAAMRGGLGHSGASESIQWNSSEGGWLVGECSAGIEDLDSGLLEDWKGLEMCVERREGAGWIMC